MKRIYLSPEIINISIDYCNNLWEDRKHNFKKPLENLSDLKEYLINQRLLTHSKYIKNIIEKYSIINRIRPEYFDMFNKRYFSMLTIEELETKINFKNNNKAFYKHIIDAMRYNSIREREFLQYVRKLKINACVYCNTQFAITTTNSQGDFSGKYELDHFKPKSRYPFLCTSFFNLQPCCANCNKSKYNKEALFCLYTKKYDNINPFNFKLSEKSIIKYMLSQNCEKLEIEFNSYDSEIKHNHEELFHITELYSMLKDVAEEIVWKSRIYNTSYIKTLKESFVKLNLHDENFKRFILGNYFKSKDIHKRPLSKFVQDIAKQLGLY